jgi:hypothetical protein
MVPDQNEAKPTSGRNSCASCVEELTISEMTQGIVQRRICGVRRFDVALWHGGLEADFFIA